MLKQFLFFALVLFGIYWTSRIVRILDGIMDGGQPLSSFFQYVALLSPASLLSVISLTAFAAATYVADRQFADSELQALQGAGFRPFRLLLPFAVFGAAAFCVSAALIHEIVPDSRARLDQLQHQIASDLAAKRLTDNQFLFPVDGLALFIGEVTPDGAMNDIFIHDSRNSDAEVTYLAERAELRRGGSGSHLLMWKGQSQELSSDGRRLSKLSYEQLRIDLALAADERPGPPGLRTIPTSETILSMQSVVDGLGVPARHVLAELHERMVEPLYAFLFPLLGASSVFLAFAYRMSRSWVILFAAAAIVCANVAGNYFADLTRADGGYWPLMYLPAVVVALLAAGMSARAHSIPRTPKFLAWLEGRAR